MYSQCPVYTLYSQDVVAVSRHPAKAPATSARQTPFTVSYSHRAFTGSCSGEPPPGQGTGGQRAPPAGEAPVVSVVVSYHNGEALTAACIRALFACAGALLL